MLAMKRSTASSWARKSRSCRFAATAIGLVSSLSIDVSWNARRTSGDGAPPIAR
jgi:hypothetical protein